MERYHPLLELAPRDVVARAIAREGIGETPDRARVVHLDMRHVKDVDLHERFPGISAFLAKYELDLERDLIPVRPAAHYMMGGVRTDLEGRTTLHGLYAAGEAACTGVHGANRLASNSLLEGLVFGARAAKAMLKDALSLETANASSSASEQLDYDQARMVEECVVRLRRMMWANAGLLREEASLRDGLRLQADSEEALARIKQQGRLSRRLAEARALSFVDRAILQSALARRESRGAHFRNDFSAREDGRYLKHSIFELGKDGQGLVRFEEW